MSGRGGTQHEIGLLVEDGLLTGVGDGVSDRARAVLAMRAAGDQQVRAMTFVPQPQTPLGYLPANRVTGTSFS